MSVVRASDLSMEDLARLGVDLPELVAEDRGVLTPWQSHGLPEEDVPSLPRTVEDPARPTAA